MLKAPLLDVRLGSKKTSDDTDAEADLGLLHGSWKPLTIITKRYILDVAAILDPPLGEGGSDGNGQL